MSAPAEATKTTLASAPARLSAGSSSLVRLYAPSVFVAKFVSTPSRVAVRSCTMHPALFTRQCSGAPDRAYASAKAATSRWRLTSQTCRVSAGPGVPTPAAVVAVPGGGASSARSFASAASPRARSRHTMCTEAFCDASCFAVAYPMPWFAPVMT